MGIGTTLCPSGLHIRNLRMDKKTLEAMSNRELVEVLQAMQICGEPSKNIRVITDIIRSRNNTEELS